MLIEDGSASTPGLSFASDTNSGLFGGSDTIGFATGGAERLEIGSSEVVFNDPSNDVDFRVESNGNTHMLFVDAGNDRIGIKESSPSTDVEISRTGNNPHGLSLTCTDNTNSPRLFFESTSTNDAPVLFSNDGNLVFHIGGTPGSSSGTERARIDTSGRLLVGTTSAAKTYVSLGLQGNGASATNQATIALAKGALPSGVDQELGRIEFVDNSGNSGGTIVGISDAAWTSGSSHATNLTFSTTASGASSPTERVRIDSSGRMGVGLSSNITSLLHVESSFAGTLAEIKNTRGSASTDAGLLVETSTTAAKTLLVQNAGTERFSVKGDGTGYLNGSLGIGTTSPGTAISASAQGLSVAHSNVAFLSLENTAASGKNYTFYANDSGALVTYDADASTERMRIDSLGRLLVGLSSSGSGSIIEAKTGTVSSSSSYLGVKAFTANMGYSTTNLTSSMLSGFDGSAIHGVDIGYSYDGTGYYLALATNGNTSGTPTERMRIRSDGNIYFHKTGTNIGTRGFQFLKDGPLEITSVDDRGLLINRLTGDGQLVAFDQDGTTEGSVTVSGSTVSYNGGHLSRWSQLAGGAARSEILRGSVLSNLDEMCEWAYEAQDAVLYTEEDELPEGVSVGDVKTPARDAGTEDNEQLNRMKVSDVEGDPNVAGVFQAWDDDDDTYDNDFYCAMTGDFIIRIAQGTTVARGDLLMSAGDGTAKPQDDDIVRSKTIAKVTSTTVSTTYSDGSYCVPCVLMAC
jgi:hypothetical protein